MRIMASGYVQVLPVQRENEKWPPMNADERRYGRFFAHAKILLDSQRSSR